jgi:DNA (cytosine-5)-methyltransferase 1
MNQCDLFAGIGAFSLAASWYGIKTTQMIEIDPYCQQILKRNFPGVPIHDDITTYYPRLGEFDIITAGFPCQDASECNPHGRGLEGERTGLFYQALRVACEVRPRFLLLENVPALLGRGFGRILGSLARNGFDAEWCCLRASEMGAPHARKRLFVIAYPIGTGTSRTGGPQTRTNQTLIGGDSWWRQNPPPPSTIRALDARFSSRLARQQLKVLGNAVVPQCAAVAYQRIMEINNDNLE